MKRALVVDDSRSARAALKKLLEEHELEVAEADSGESALDYLKRDSVDVIFMDHTMPGMDGLEAVSAIKANPQTATIPVMMYTTKEGEVYVGQARALGAVGVLPKNVQPHQLFEMLLNLGLVHDRRAEPRLSAELTEAVDEVDRALDNQALGMSVQALVTRILEDQHLTLRSDILRSQKTLARQVAHEILKEQALAPEDADAQANASNPAKGGQSRSWLAVAGFVAAFVCAFLAFQFKHQRDVAYRELVAVETSRAQSDTAEVNELKEALGGAQSSSAEVVSAALGGYAEVLNQDTATDMYEDAFSEALADQLVELLPYIERMGFVGDITLTSHLGNFCLMVDDAGVYQLAPDDLPLEACNYMGHVLENNDYVSDRLSEAFSRLLAAQTGSEVGINLVALTAGESEPLVDVGGGALIATAGEWNRVARQNNRVVITFE